ncbi:MAG: LamB/YcsF family protein [Bacteroidia bacterium]|nr:LamB/YcsF family protein [Bacteroidia bacterium]
MKKFVDINCDMGESYGHFKVGNDDAIMPFISSCNLACGFHGGDPLTILKSLKRAIHHELRIGAHPSLLNLRGFGRDVMEISVETLEADLIYQISALSGMAKSLGKDISYIKPHGYLYQLVNHQEKYASCMIRVAKMTMAEPQIMGLPASYLNLLCQNENISFIREAFLDRRYHPNGGLQSRKEEGAVLHSPEEVIIQLKNILNGKIETSDGRWIAMEADSLCIHGDHPNSVAIATEVYNYLKENSIKLNSN